MAQPTDTQHKPSPKIPGGANDIYLPENPRVSGGNANIYLIIGSDILSTIHKWKDFNHITRLSNIIVQSRVSKNIESLLNNELKSLISTDLGIFHAESYGKIYIQETSLVDISSTEIRDRLQKNQDISNLTPPLIEKWLLERKIY